MRDIHDVIEKMIAKIPADQDRLIAQLEGVAYTSCYTPPECASKDWIAASHILHSFFGPVPKLDWQREVIMIYNPNFQG